MVLKITLVVTLLCFASYSDGTYLLKNLRTDMVMEASHFNTVRMSLFQNKSTQLWEKIPAIMGCFYIKNVATREVLTGHMGGSISMQSDVSVLPYWGQVWYFSNRNLVVKPYISKKLRQEEDGIYIRSVLLNSNFDQWAFVTPEEYESELQYKLSMLNAFTSTTTARTVRNLGAPQENNRTQLQILEEEFSKKKNSHREGDLLDKQILLEFLKLQNSKNAVKFHDAIPIE